MENLQYIIEDSTIAELLGVQNFTSDESAILELIKNAYDAGALKVNIEFANDSISVVDTGRGMNADDIKAHWMHVGKSSKTYSFENSDGERVLAGSKGIGRFALARLGGHAIVYSKKYSFDGIVWETNWNTSTLTKCDNEIPEGTTIIINKLRVKWTLKKVEKLIEFISKTYNDTRMQIFIKHPQITKEISKFFVQPQPGINCLSYIKLKYNSQAKTLSTEILSDEFKDDARDFCGNVDIKHFKCDEDMVKELNSFLGKDFTEEDLISCLEKLGDFTADFMFSISASTVDAEKFLYKHTRLSQSAPSGVVLYRNAFSISSYEGRKDWLGFGKRSRKSPAAASHPTGAWRVRENQISGKVEIDKKKNEVLQDLSNRQGLDENIFYELFIEIILSGIKQFERYRQWIIRKIDIKNKVNEEPKETTITDIVIADPSKIFGLTSEQSEQFIKELAAYKKADEEARKQTNAVESRYKYDVRILNVLATVGLKASSIAHEMRNDKNSIAENIDSAIEALKEYGMWEELTSEDKTEKVHRNVPYLLESNKEVCSKLVVFINTMLSEIEKKQFKAKSQSVYDILSKIKKNWERDYAWIEIHLLLDDDICFLISQDYLQVVFDNLILNSVQQNDNNNHLDIYIKAELSGSMLLFSYTDNGCGLDDKYSKNPRKILEVHETTRDKGHGLGMWIVNNTVNMSGGDIIDILPKPGFGITFLLGETK